MADTSLHSEDKFLIGQTADDLVDLIISVVDKRNHEIRKTMKRESDGEALKNLKTPKFPNFLYNTLVDEMITNALQIQECVILSNEMYQNGSPERKQNGKKALAICVLLNHRVRLSADKKWINEKERDKLQTLITAIRWKIYYWIK